MHKGDLSAGAGDSGAQDNQSENVRDYGMFIALFVIMTFFSITTKGIFISSRNISNLINQTGYIACWWWG